MDVSPERRSAVNYVHSSNGDDFIMKIVIPGKRCHNRKGPHFPMGFEGLKVKPVKDIIAVNCKGLHSCEGYHSRNMLLRTLAFARSSS